MTFKLTSLARIAVPAALVVAAPVAANPASDMAQVQKHLAGAQSMTANFTQTDGKGRQQAGMLSLKKPGKIRFEYGKGADMLLVPPIQSDKGGDGEMSILGDRIHDHSS